MPSHSCGGCGGCHHRQPDRAGRNAAAPCRRCARHGAPQCSQPQATADLPGARAFSPLPPRRLWCGGWRALGSGSCGLPPHACACACGECATCAPSRCAKRLGPAVERHHLCGSAARAGLVAPCSEAHDGAAGTKPALHELLADARWHEGPAGPAASRMPHRA